MQFFNVMLNRTLLFPLSLHSSSHNDVCTLIAVHYRKFT